MVRNYGEGELDGIIGDISVEVTPANFHRRGQSITRFDPFVGQLSYQQYDNLPVREDLGKLNHAAQIFVAEWARGDRAGRIIVQPENGLNFVAGHGVARCFFQRGRCFQSAGNPISGIKAGARVSMCFAKAAGQWLPDSMMSIKWMSRTNEL